MIEPRPKKVTKELLNDRIVRVGIVLEEDSIQAISATTFEHPMECNKAARVEPHQRLLVERKNSEIVLKNDSGDVLACADKLVFSFPNRALSAPSMRISPIVTGRGFHWNKQIDADFPGNFEISSKPDGIQIVNSLHFEEYLACVVVSEMSADAPKEFVKAQTIAARSWAVCFLHAKHPGREFELCNDDDCQRYHGLTYAKPETIEYALASRGQYLFDSTDHVMPGYYSKCCGGVSERAEDSFGMPINDLVSVIDGQTAASPTDITQWLSLAPLESQRFNCGVNQSNLGTFLGGVDDPGEYFRWEHRETKADLAHYLNTKSDIKEAKKVTSVVPLQRGVSGRLHQVCIHYLTQDNDTKTHICQNQYQIRNLLHSSFLYSSAVSIHDQGSSILFKGAGWGHGVGLCQMGACNLAMQGKKNEQILKHYFPKASLKQCY